jgi:hypothetical protein
MAKIVTRLEAARAALAEINGKLAELSRTRKERLIAGDAPKQLAAIDNQIADLQRAAQIESDRIALLEAQAAREQCEAAAKQRSGLTDRFAGVLEEADGLAEELQNDLAAVERKFRKIIELRERARHAWPLGDSSLNAAAETPEGAALSGAAVYALLKHELYRIGARPFLGGRPGAKAEVAFPGGACPKIEWTMTPEKITPLADVLRRASAFAVEAMRGKLDPLAALPPSQTVPANGSEAQARLSRLLNEQARLATDVTPEGEQRYEQVVAQVAALQAEITAGASL